MMRLKNGNELELYFNLKDASYTGTDEWIKKNHYSVVELYEENETLFIKNTIFRSVSKNECINEMKKLLSHVQMKRSYLYAKYKNM